MTKMTEFKIKVLITDKYSPLQNNIVEYHCKKSIEFGNKCIDFLINGSIIDTWENVSIAKAYTLINSWENQKILETIIID